MSVDEILPSSRYQPLERIICYDIFNTGFNGWMTLLPNFTGIPTSTFPYPGQQRPVASVMLSSATYRYPGHGAIIGHIQSGSSLASRALTLRGYSGAGFDGTHAIKRLSFYRPESRFLQIECWFSYTAEQDTLDAEGTPQPVCTKSILWRRV